MKEYNYDIDVYEDTFKITILNHECDITIAFTVDAGCLDAEYEVLCTDRPDEGDYAHDVNMLYVYSMLARFCNHRRVRRIFKEWIKEVK